MSTENLKMLFMFRKLRDLRLRFDHEDYLLGQPVVGALAELLHLTRLELLAGRWGTRGGQRVCSASSQVGLRLAEVKGGGRSTKSWGSSWLG